MWLFGRLRLQRGLIEQAEIGYGLQESQGVRVVVILKGSRGLNQPPETSCRGEIRDEVEECALSKGSKSSSENELSRA